PARYWARSTAARLAAAIFAAGETRVRARLVRSEPAPFALGVEPDLSNETLMALHPKLNDDVDEEIEKALDVLPRELCPAVALLDKQDHLLEGELRARGVDARDRARMSGIHVSQVIERFFGSKLGEQNPIGLHAQARLQEL